MNNVNSEGGYLVFTKKDTKHLTLYISIDKEWHNYNLATNYRNNPWKYIVFQL